MISRDKMGRVSLGGLLLFVGLLTIQAGDIASAANQNKTAQTREAGGKKGQGLPCDIPPGQNLADAKQDANMASRLITGELIRMDGNDFAVKEESGKEVHFQLTESTEKPPVTQGDQISVSLDNKNNALWIRANRGTDRRTEHASSDCNPTEEPSDKLMNKSKAK